MAGAVGNLPIRDFPQPSFSPYDVYPTAPPTSSGTTSQFTTTG
jgi:hypothetical protein